MVSSTLYSGLYCRVVRDGAGCECVIPKALSRTCSKRKCEGLTFAIFQMTFAIIGAAIISGAVVERIRFSAYAIFIVVWVLAVYVPLCHWIWGGGWIAEMGAKDDSSQFFPVNILVLLMMVPLSRVVLGTFQACEGFCGRHRGAHQLRHLRHRAGVPAG